jgi:hypothetical protein
LKSTAQGNNGKGPASSWLCLRLQGIKYEYGGKREEPPNQVLFKKTAAKSQKSFK